MCGDKVMEIILLHPEREYYAGYDRSGSTVGIRAHRINCSHSADMKDYVLLCIASERSITMELHQQ